MCHTGLPAFVTWLMCRKSWQPFTYSWCWIQRCSSGNLLGAGGAPGLAAVWTQQAMAAVEMRSSRHAQPCLSVHGLPPECKYACFSLCLSDLLHSFFFFQKKSLIQNDNETVTLRKICVVLKKTENAYFEKLQMDLNNFCIMTNLALYFKYFCVKMTKVFGFDTIKIHSVQILCNLDWIF